MKLEFPVNKETLKFFNQLKDPNYSQTEKVERLSKKFIEEGIAQYDQIVWNNENRIKYLKIVIDLAMSYGSASTLINIQKYLSENDVDLVLIPTDQ